MSTVNAIAIRLYICRQFSDYRTPQNSIENLENPRNVLYSK